MGTNDTVITGSQAWKKTGGLFSTQRGTAYPVDGVKLLAPVRPSKIVCVGRNYRDHAKELGNEVPGEPLIFLKPPSAIVAAGEAIVYPPITQSVHHEGELGVVIGRRARHVPAEEAWDCVFGFTCVNDVTARDLQKKDGQWTRGKGFDTFCPVGPWIVRRQDVTFEELRVRTLLDGQVRQDGSVRDMIFPVNVIIAFVTQFMTLEAGDLIATGTPSGVGAMLPGSTVAVEIPGIGVLTNPIVKG
ncbi:MAG: fumarylacetoacetate hydrolase family protein [Candidatus Solibacter usitatus]|nr:fumarylacetoacetate hydrolase family protein [Candidatus Solibacter usitatus]